MRTLTNPPSLKDRLSADRRVVALFIMSTCPFCHRFTPIFESFARVRAKAFDCLTVVLDDQNNPLWDEYGIEVVPTVLVFQGRETVSRIDGRPGEGLARKDLETL